MPTLENDGRFGPRLVASRLVAPALVTPSPVKSCLQLAPDHAVSWPRATINRWLRCSVAPLGLLAVLSAGAPAPGMGQTLAQAGKKPDDLPPVVVTTSQRKPARRVNSAAQHG